MRFPPLLLFVVALFLPLVTNAAPAKLGAYYFDGWTSKTYHVTDRLKNEFGQREPVWGWYDNTSEIMERQIDFAANGGLSFWAFCWYWPEKGDHTTPLNNALGLYLEAKNRARLQFCLLVANHGGYRIGPKEWPEVCAQWIPLFKQPTQLTVDGKPLIIFFSPGELIKAFGSPEAVKSAFDQLRAEARAAGLPGVTIAGCKTPDLKLTGSEFEPIRACGFDVFTGYNHHTACQLAPNTKAQAFAGLIPGHEAVWNALAERGGRPCIPVVTAGWDMRPWEALDCPIEKQSIYFADRSPALLRQFTRAALDWVAANPSRVTAEKLILFYAWNENGEGGYLTPTKAEGTAYLDAVKAALEGR